MKKEDLRIRRTKQSIKMSFLHLLEIKTLEKITIKEITDNAMCNRNTFYLHYLDKEDLMEQMCKQCIEDFEKAINYAGTDALTFDSKSFEFISAEIVKAVVENLDFYKIILGGKKSSYFTDNIRDVIVNHICHGLNIINRNSKSKKIEAEYIASGIVGVISFWLMNQEIYSKEEFTIELVKLMTVMGNVILYNIDEI